MDAPLVWFHNQLEPLSQFYKGVMQVKKSMCQTLVKHDVGTNDNKTYIQELTQLKHKAHLDGELFRY